MDVSIIMINYNTFDLTSQTIDGLKKFTKDIDYEIILIDNDSPDKSGGKLREKYKKDIIFIQAEENLGTSKAFNKCLKIAKGKYVLWLNTDVIFINNFIKVLFDYMESHIECGICGGNLLDLDGKPCHSFLDKITSLKTAKRDTSIINLLKKKMFHMPSKYEYNYLKKPIEVGYITGADMMVRHEIFDKIGGFDEDIFMYAEEVEFTSRVKEKTSYKVVSVPTATLIHLGGKSVSDQKFSKKREELFLAGNVIYFRKCYGDDVAKKYLRILYKRYRKLVFVSKLLFMKEKTEKNKKRIEVVKELINSFESREL